MWRTTGSFQPYFFHDFPFVKFLLLPDTHTSELQIERGPPSQSGDALLHTCRLGQKWLFFIRAHDGGLVTTCLLGRVVTHLCREISCLLLNVRWQVSKEILLAFFGLFAHAKFFTLIIKMCLSLRMLPFVMPKVPRRQAKSNDIK